MDGFSNDSFGNERNEMNWRIDSDGIMTHKVVPVSND